MTIPPFKKGVGRLATDRYDFEDHLEGINPAGFTNFRHTADQIDMNPAVIGGAGTVQSSFSNVAAFIASTLNNGQGFITVGDGYDTWHAADGSTNFDPAIPSLDTLLNPVFSAITNNTTIPSGFARIKRGGIIVIKAGTYIVKKTINVPPGITLLGEGYGTKIVNATNLNLTSLPPTPLTAVTIVSATNASPIQIVTSSPIPTLATNDTININNATGNTAVNGTFVVTTVNNTTFNLNGSSGNGTYTANSASLTTMEPVFKILPDTARSINDGSVDNNLFMFSRETRIMNLVIGDNFIENTILGDVFYKVPQNKTSSTSQNPPGLIQQQAGSNLLLSNVYLIGKANFSSGQNVSAVTGYGLKLDNTIPSSTGTILKVNDCFIDGFAQPISFRPTAFSKDYLEVSRNKIRAYGNLDGYSSGSTDPSKNCIIRTTICNSTIVDNYLYGNSGSVLSGVFVTGGGNLSIPLEQNLSRLLVADNNFAVNKLSGSTNLSFAFLRTGDGYADGYLTQPSSVTQIANVTPTFPVVIFTPTANTFVTGQQLAISGVGGISSANGLRTITRISSNQFSLNGVFGSGTYTAGTGQIQSIFSALATCLVTNNNMNFDGYSGNRQYIDNASTPQYTFTKTTATLAPDNYNSTVNLAAKTTVNVTAATDVNVTGTNNVNVVGVEGVNISATDDSTNVAIVSNSGNVNITSGFVNDGSSGPASINVTAAQTGNIVLTAASSNVSLVASGASVNVGTNQVQIGGTIIGKTGDPLRLGLNAISLGGVGLNGTLVLSTSQYTAQTILLTGTINGNITVQLPAVAGYAKFIHVLASPLSGSNASITVQTTSAANGVVMTPGERLWVYCDGTNLYSDRPYRMIATSQYAGTGSFSNTISTSTSTSFVDSLVTTSVNNAVTGDILYISGIVTLFNASSSQFTQSVLTVIDGSTTDLTEAQGQGINSNYLTIPINTSKVISATGAITVTAKIRYKVTSGTGTVIVPSALQLRLVRP